MNIDEIISSTLKKEGGYSNHPNDKGGETCWGITVNVARANGYNGAMKDLPLDMAIKIYKSEYWVQPRFGLVANSNAKIAEELFDTGVNCGTSFAKNSLQNALNLLNQNQTLFQNLKVDGAIGQKTIDALNICLKRPNGEQIVLKVLNGLQFEKYANICRQNENQESFFWGWVSHRVN